MKPLRFVLSLVLIALPSVALAQPNAQQSFDLMKSLAGTWEAPATAVTPAMHVTLRVTSSGNAVMHEMTSKGRPDDPITMFYMDGGRLIATHYCDAGNRPRFVGKISPDGKSVAFDLVDVSGSTLHGHMQHIVFTSINANHHTEDWTYMLPGGKEVHAHFDLHRVR